MKIHPEVPYNDLPLLPPKAELETQSVLKKAITANRALSELNSLGNSIPNQAILISAISLQEAKASSEIENIITTNDTLYRAITAKKNNVDGATKEVIRYREALWEGFSNLKQKSVITGSMLIRIVQIIKQNEAGIRNLPGTIIKNFATNKILYTPPVGEQVILELLKNLEKYINQDNGADTLIKMAVIHYQFEAIHPFFDGNGRTGRILNTLYLVKQGLLDLPILYLSRYINLHKAKYYQLLHNVSFKNEWEPWVLFMLEATEETAIYTKTKIRNIRQLYEDTLAQGKRDLPPRVFSPELIEVIFSQPYTKIETLVKANIAKRKTAAEYLKELEKLGILKSEKAGKEMLYLNIKLYEILAQ